MKRDIPLKWKPHFDARNIDSIRGLARGTRMHQSTAGRVIFGEETSADSIATVADFFNLKVEEVQRLRGEVPSCLAR